MTGLAFAVAGVAPEPYAAAPHLRLVLRVTDTSGGPVHAAVLRCQVRVEPRRRPYSAEEQAGLTDLFGTPDRYPASLTSFLLTHTVAAVPSFEGTTDVELLVPVSYDFDVAAGKYLHALRDGDVPLVLLLSGTILRPGPQGFSVEQVARTAEAPFALPVRVWRELMAQHYGGTGWVRLDHETVEQLARFRAGRSLPSWDAAVNALLSASAVSP